MLKRTVSKETASMSIHDIFFIVFHKKPALQLGKLEKQFHPSISILTPVFFLSFFLAIVPASLKLEHYARVC